MEDYQSQAFELVKAQAGVREMNEEEMKSMLLSLTNSLKDISEGCCSAEHTAQAQDLDPKKAVKEKSVTCLECGKTFKVLTKRHLALHDLDVDEYKKKWGYKKSQSLVAKSLARERRKKMQEMELWKRRKK